MDKTLIQAFLAYVQTVQASREGDAQYEEILAQIGGYHIAIDEITYGKAEGELSPKDVQAVAWYQAEIEKRDAKLRDLTSVTKAMTDELENLHRNLAKVAYRGKNGDNEFVYQLPMFKVVGKRVLIPGYEEMESGDYSGIRLKTYTRIVEDGKGAALIFPFSGQWPY